MSAPAPPRSGRADGSMSLLVDMMTNTLDESYVAAARRRAGEPTASPGTAPVRRRTVVPLLVVLGVLTGTAAAQAVEELGAWPNRMRPAG